MKKFLFNATLAGLGIACGITLAYKNFGDTEPVPQADVGEGPFVLAHESSEKGSQTYTLTYCQPLNGTILPTNVPQGLQDLLANDCPEGSRITDSIEYIDYNDDGQADEINQGHVGYLFNTLSPYLLQETESYDAYIAPLRKNPSYSLIMLLTDATDGTFGAKYAALDLYLDGTIDPMGLRDRTEGNTSISEIYRDDATSQVILSRKIIKDTNGLVQKMELTFDDGSTELWTRENGWPWQQEEKEKDPLSYCQRNCK